jgi:hypothetical protein
MSHFLVGVIIPKDTASVRAKVEELLEPYDENTEVEEYDRDCYCIGNIASMEARKQTEEKLGTFQTFRDTYNALPKDQQPKWKDHIKPFVDLHEKLTKEHSQYQKPDKNCPDCHGTGKEKSHYNPDSKWDWWRIGGRWDGIISNIGKYRESEDNGFNFDPYHEDVKNNSCLVRELKANHLPFAIITPDGEWHEKGQMGWWGVTHNEKEDDKWNKELFESLKEYKDDLIVGVDCHI